MCVFKPLSEWLRPCWDGCGFGGWVDDDRAKVCGVIHLKQGGGHLLAELND